MNNLTSLFVFAVLQIPISWALVTNIEPFTNFPPLLNWIVIGTSWLLQPITTVLALARTGVKNWTGLRAIFSGFGYEIAIVFVLTCTANWLFGTGIFFAWNHFLPAVLIALGGPPLAGVLTWIGRNT